MLIDLSAYPALIGLLDYLIVGPGGMPATKGGNTFGSVRHMFVDWTYRVKLKINDPQIDFGIPPSPSDRDPLRGANC